MADWWQVLSNDGKVGTTRGAGRVATAGAVVDGAWPRGPGTVVVEVAEVVVGVVVGFGTVVVDGGAGTTGTTLVTVVDVTVVGVVVTVVVDVVTQVGLVVVVTVVVGVPALVTTVGALVRPAGAVAVVAPAGVLPPVATRLVDANTAMVATAIPRRRAEPGRVRMR